MCSSEATQHAKLKAGALATFLDGEEENRSQYRQR